MIKFVLRNILRFIILIVMQVLIFNNLKISYYEVIPFFYVIFILLLPFETPNALLLILSFTLGLSVDVFSDTIGIHTSACLLAAFMRPFTLNLLAPRDNYELETLPRISYYGFTWFLKYTLIIVFAHHTLYFIVDIFSFKQISLLLFKILTTGVFTTFLIILSQYLVFRD